MLASMYNKYVRSYVTVYMCALQECVYLQNHRKYYAREHLSVRDCKC
jgi:hypothetical protein